MFALTEEETTSLGVSEEAELFSIQELDDRITKIRGFLKKTVMGEARYKVDEKVEAFLKTNQPFVLVVNHNDMLSWVTAIPHMAREMRKMSDANKIALYPHMSANKIASKIPGFRFLISYLSGAINDNFDEIVTTLKGKKKAYFVAVPESDNCNFVFKDPIAPFKNMGLFKAALIAGVPFVLVTFTQERPLGFHIKSNNRFLNKIREGAIGLKLPFLNKTDVMAYFDFYDPHVNPEAFASMNSMDKRKVIKTVGDDIRAMMISRYRYLEKGSEVCSDDWYTSDK